MSVSHRFSEEGNLSKSVSFRAGSALVVVVGQPDHGVWKRSDGYHVEWLYLHRFWECESGALSVMLIFAHHRVDFWRLP